MPLKDIAAWNSMIYGYLKFGRVDESATRSKSSAVGRGFGSLKWKMKKNSFKLLKFCKILI